MVIAIGIATCRAWMRRYGAKHSSAMHASIASSSPDACPASVVIMATRLAKTPLAIADAHTPGTPILFANEAFAALVDVDATALVGRSLGLLAALPVVDIGRGATTRFELAVNGGSSLPVALSTAEVPGPDGRPFCLLCSLVDARGEGADEAIARDAELLAQVARAACDLMRESGAAARTSESGDRGATASGIALEAIAHAARRLD
jgi:hypothetical protein